ncbi:MAG: tandem-95 repeat protein, partial [Betaproteobacteria bacterium]|nr:tandem-95 repeat protein [Betaproteobacteria bacterium]
TTVTATDADLPAQTLGYAISGGADAARFAIDAASGALSFVAAPDFELPADADLDNVYEVTVTVSDGAGGAASQSISVTVTDVAGALAVDTTADTVDGDTSSVEALLASRGADGRISLREAILAANATAGADTVLLGAGSHVLSIAGGNENAAASGDLDITDDLTLVGVGAAASVVDGAGLDRVFEVASGVTVSLSQLAITGGDAANKWGGGLYAHSAAVVSLDRVAVTGNAGDTGGGLYSEGATLTLTDSSVSGNSGKWGGGLYVGGGTVTLERVTFSGNSASSDGGGFYHAGAGALLTARNLTVSGNSAAGAGGGIYSARDMDLTNVTIAFNTAASGGGLSINPPGTVSLRNSIVANNGGGNADDTPLSLGNNLDSDGSLGLAGPGDLSGVDPQLAPLAGNGGATLTHALAGTSAAINAGTAAGAPATDQRGVARLGQVDMGAYEFNPGSAVAPVITANALVIGEGQAVVLGAANLNAADADSTPAELLWTVSGVSGGRFELVASPGVAVTSFTQDDVLNARVRFVHDGGEAAPAWSATVSDGLLADGPRAAAIGFTPANDAPVAGADSHTVAEDGVLVVPAAGGVLANDSDADGDTLAAVLVTSPFHGSLAMAADGSFSYRPDADFSGVDSFTYRATDGALDSGVTLVSITVSPVNDAPVAGADRYTVAADGTLAVPAAGGVLANDTDADGDALATTLVSAPGRGVLSLNADGSFAYTPEPGFHGADSFAYRASDGAGGTTQATVFITVLAANPPPPDPPQPAAAPEVTSVPTQDPPQASADGPAGAALAPSGLPLSALGDADGPNARGGAEAPPPPVATRVVLPALWTATATAAEAAAPRDAMALLAELSRDPAADGQMTQRIHQAMGSAAFRQELDRLRQTLEEKGEIPPFAAASTMALSSGLSVGYVMWLLRGGLLVSGVLSSLPAWRVVDPLPVLARARPRDAAAGDDESLEAMVARASGEADSSDDDDEPLTAGEGLNLDSSVDRSFPLGRPHGT